MSKFLLIFAFILTSCGYQPIYVNKSLNTLEFAKINIDGDREINKKIINSLSFKENEFDDTLNNLLIKSSYKINENDDFFEGCVLAPQIMAFLKAFSRFLKNSSNFVNM